MNTKPVRWAYISLTSKGLSLCTKIQTHFAGDILTIEKRRNVHTTFSFDTLSEMIEYAFSHYDCLVFVMAAGIVVRTLAKLIKDKTQDPAVLVLDENGEYCVSLLSGHIGGANGYAREVAHVIGAQEVITTASDVAGKVAVDTLAMQMDCAVSDMNAAKDITAMIVNGEKVMVCGLHPSELPDGLVFDTIDNATDYDGVICFSDQKDMNAPVRFVQLIPRHIVVGMGCRKGTKTDAIRGFIREEIDKLGLRIEAVQKIVSVDVKSNEAGFIEAAEQLGVLFETISRGDIAKVEQRFTGSAFVRQTIGVSCVAQPCGYIAANGGDNLVDIRKKDGMTLSIWQRRSEG